MKSWRKLKRSTGELLRRNQVDFFPVRRHLKTYNKGKVHGDLRAGLNVALLAFPQGMAYAAIAGLPIEYGIFGSAIAALIGPLFSGSRFIMLGPTNATSVLLFSAFLTLDLAGPEKLALVPLVVFLSGIFLIVGSFLRVANLIQFVSRSVVAGYITAAAIYIIINQMRKVMGITFDIPKGSTLVDVAWLTTAGIPEAHIPTVALSIITAITYIILNRFFRKLPNVAITLVAMSFVAAGMNYALAENPDLSEQLGGPIVLLQSISASDWNITLPAFSLEWVALAADTALIIAFLSVLEGTSIGKSLAARAGEKLDTNQEMFGMGMANIACAFYNGMPASGSLTRSQLNWSSGASSPLSSIFCGLFVAMGAYIFGPFTGAIPSSVLGVLVIAIGISLVNRHVLRIVLKATRSDATVFVVTFLAALFVRLDFAIILGALTSIVLFLRKAAVPELVEYGSDAEGAISPAVGGQKIQRQTISIVHVEGELFFGATEIFRDQMRRVCEDTNLKVVILKLRNAHNLDATSVLALEELINYMKEHNRLLLISEVRKDALRVFKRSGLIETIGRDNIFPDNVKNPTLSTAHALKRSREVLGKDAEISIFVGTEKGRKRQEAAQAGP